MEQKIELSWADINERAKKLVLRTGSKVYGVPNGGIPAALAVQNVTGCQLVDDPTQADVFVDDIIDSGETKRQYTKAFGKPFVALIDKPSEGLNGAWVSLPWERMQKQDGPQDNIRRILQYIGEDPTREGLLETPDRVVRSYGELFAGYKQDPKDVMKTFEDGTCDEMVLLKSISFNSVCEHHMMSFGGVAHIAYLPNKRIIGLSKLARLLEIYARRLQVQERLTTQVTEALDKHLEPLGAACIIEAQHSCMTCRGVLKQNAVMVTSSLTGEFRKPEVRAEFFNLIKG